MFARTFKSSKRRHRVSPNPSRQFGSQVYVEVTYVGVDCMEGLHIAYYPFSFHGGKHRDGDL